MNRELDYTYLPEHMRKEAREYIEFGTLPGPFLRVIIRNGKLTEAFEEADKANISRVFDFVCFFRNEAPLACWGSKKRMISWITSGGLEGRKRELENVP